jgi:hypothetical protein
MEPKPGTEPDPPRWAWVLLAVGGAVTVLGILLAVVRISVEH